LTHCILSSLAPLASFKVASITRDLKIDANQLVRNDKLATPSTKPVVLVKMYMVYHSVIGTIFQHLLNIR